MLLESISHILKPIVESSPNVSLSTVAPEKLSVLPPSKITRVSRSEGCQIPKFPRHYVIPLSRHILKKGTTQNCCWGPHNSIAKRSGPFSCFLPNRTFQIIKCQISQLLQCLFLLQCVLRLHIYLNVLFCHFILCKPF